jgi:hypothetical protein
MKYQTKKTQWLSATLCSLALACSTSLIQAQTAQDYIVNQFDDGAGAGLWAYNYGNTTCTIEFDPNEDRGPGAMPGAMKVTIPFDLCNGFNQSDFEKVLADTLDLTKYSKLHFSVKVDPSSSHLSDWGAGALGNLRPHIRLSSWGGDVDMSTPNSQWVDVSAYGGWVDYAMDINQTDNLGTKVATGILGIDIWSGWGSCDAPVGHTNTVVFWMDNIWFEYNTNTAPPPPPMMGLAKAGPMGVQIAMDNDGDQWQRNAITTPDATGPYLWASQGVYPVTYSCTITNFPDAGVHPGFEAHMYLVNGDTSGSGNVLNGATDWNSPDIFIFRLENVDTGGVRAQIQWKTNYPASNATNIPVIVDGATALGTWSVTFTDATNGTLSGPGITSTNFTLPEDAVLNNFSSGSSYIQFGMFKNDGANDGHNNQIYGTFSRVSFNGVAAPFDDNFDDATLTNTYAWRKTSATAVQHIPAGTAWALDWTLPATGFNVETAAAINGPWNPASLITSYQGGGFAHALVAQSALPGENASYFRLVSRPFTKLQVLMPGEANAPNTATGKTGTPTAQFYGIPFNVIVNAVDAYWNVVNSSDTINLTSSDATAVLPADAALSLGSRTFSVTFSSPGDWTVTATDVTDGTKTANTSSLTNSQ